MKGGCNYAHCNLEGRKDTLNFSKCKCHIHYICSNLPAYQVDLFLNAKNYRYYICKSCCGVLPDSFRVKSRSTEDDVWKE